MSRSAVNTLWIAPALAFAALQPAPSEVALKCGQALGPPLYAIDGEIKGLLPDSSKSITPPRKDIYAVDVVCMDVRDSTFRKGGAGIPVVSIWTVHGPAAKLEPTLSAILAAQDARGGSGLGYTADLSALGLSGLPATMQVTVDAYERGWMATAVVERLLSTCLVFDGDVPAADPRLAAREPACFYD